MDEITQIDPVTMANDRLIAVVAIWAFVAITGIIATRTDSRAARGLDIGPGRSGRCTDQFQLSNLDAFMIESWTMLAIWRGGFSSLIGAGAAAIAIAIILGRRPASLAITVNNSGK